jgi:hypothetical protein
MLASKHSIYLSKNYQLDGATTPSTNVFMFNENGPTVYAKWVKKNVDLNNGCFVIMDHKQAIMKEVEKSLKKRNYYIENINFSDADDEIKINPFDLVKDTSEIHFMFLNFLYAMWDNTDPDITAMSNLIDAFASCVFFMFANQKDKMNMTTLRKMVYSVRANCQTPDGVIPMSDAIFTGIKDQESMPCKYYAQFKKAAGERQDEVAEKLAKVFDMFTENDIRMMSKTDPNLEDSLRFKTAIFVNIDKAEEEHSAKIMTVLLNYFVQHTAQHAHVLFVIDDLDAKHTLISLPHWMKEASDHDMSYLVINENLAEFKATPRAEKFFRNLQKTVEASILVHRNDAVIKFANELPTTYDDMDEMMENECVATVIIPSAEISENDELF